MTARAIRWGKGVTILGVLTLVVTMAIAVYGSVRADIRNGDANLQMQIDKKVGVARFEEFKAGMTEILRVQTEHIDKRMDRLETMIKEHDRKVGP